MLIKFSVSNFLSFNEPATLDMMKGRPRFVTHPTHIVKAKDHNDVDLLRAALIYGANASGKSNLVKAMAFAQDIAIRPRTERARIGLTPFKLKADATKAPSQFEFDFRTKGRRYNYGFVIQDDEIREEWLYQTFKKREDELIFERDTERQADGRHQNRFTWSKAFGKALKPFLANLELATKPNESLLAEVLDNNARNIAGLELIVDAYDWFRGSLQIIYTHSKPAPHRLEMNLDGIRDFLSRLLKHADTGIVDVELVKTVEDVQIPPVILDELEDGVVLLVNEMGSRRVLIKEAGQVEVRKLVFYHALPDGSSSGPFELEEESDGTRRLVELAPVFHDLSWGRQGRVLVIDEIDRSLHAQLTGFLLSLHLEGYVDKPESQLILTTHECYLMDLDKVRSDEIWFTEKDEQGETRLYSLDDFQPRFDKDVRKDYLLGRYGAIPFVADPRRLRKQ